MKFYVHARRMAKHLRSLTTCLALLLTAACASRPASAPAGAVAAGAGSADVAAGADNAADVAPALDATATADAATVADAPVALPGDSAGPAGNGPRLARIHLSSKINLQGQCAVKLLPAATSGQSDFFNSADSVVCDQVDLALPMVVQCKVPVGQWLVFATVYKSGGKFQGGGMACSATNAAWVVSSAAEAPLVQDIDLVLGGPEQLHACFPSQTGAPLPSKSAFSEVISVATPPTAAGGAHLVQGVVWDQRWWVAGSQDGIVSFDFPKAVPNPAPSLQNWQVHGEAFCDRLARAGNVLFCSSRSAVVKAVVIGPAQTILAKHVISLADSPCVEGMAPANGLLYLAAHGQGLRAVSATAPFALKVVNNPPELNDAWDVAALPPGSDETGDRLLVADGMNGLRLLDVSGAKALAPVVLASLPLPGRAAFLDVKDGNVAVGALGGGVHLVTVSPMNQLILRGSAQLPGDVYGVALHGTRLVGAAGHQVVAWLMPATGQQGPLAVAGLLPSKFYALDVKSFGADLLSAEFQAVRHLTLDAQLQQPAALVVPLLVTAPATKVGDAIQTSLRLTNLGSAPATFGKFMFREVKGGNGVPLPTPQPLAPGQSVTLPIAALKTLKGLQEHELGLASNDPTQPQVGVMLIEVTWLQPGDALPVVQYQDAAGKLVDVNKLFQGKVGVLIVGAHTCPVAFLGLAAAGAALQPLLQDGQVAAAAVDPWDLPSAPEAMALTLPFPMLYSPLTTSDGHDASEVLDTKLGQPIKYGPPMPIVYVVGKDGKIAFAQWGWETGLVLEAIQAAKGKP